MPTSRAFAFNTGTTISGTEQVGSIAVNSGTTLSGNIKTFCQIATTNTSGSLGIDKYGRVWSWGSDLNGQLGHNYTYRTPMMICQ